MEQQNEISEVPRGAESSAVELLPRLHSMQADALDSEVPEQTASSNGATELVNGNHPEGGPEADQNAGGANTRLSQFGEVRV